MRQTLHLAVLVALAGAPAIVGSQALPSPAAPTAQTPSDVLVARLRAGISPAADRPLAPADTTETGAPTARERVAHAAIGGGIGLLAGAAAGAAIGYYYDTHPHGSDSMFPASAFGAVIGAGFGLVSGLVVGALIH